MKRQVACPRCGTQTEFSPANPSRPFCSERCKLIDLGQWANEDFRIPTQDNSSIQDLPDHPDAEEEGSDGSHLDPH